MYYCLIVYISITNEPIFKTFALFDCLKAKLYVKMLVVVLPRRFHVEKQIDKLAQIQALDGMRKNRPIFPVNILDVIQKAELVFVFSELGIN